MHQDHFAATFVQFGSQPPAAGADFEVEPRPFHLLRNAIHRDRLADEKDFWFHHPPVLLPMTRAREQPRGMLGYPRILVKVNFRLDLRHLKALLLE